MADGLAQLLESARTWVVRVNSQLGSRQDALDWWEGFLVDAPVHLDAIKVVCTSNIGAADFRVPLQIETRRFEEMIDGTIVRLISSGQVPLDPVRNRLHEQCREVLAHLARLLANLGSFPMPLSPLPSTGPSVPSAMSAPAGLSRSQSEEGTLEIPSGGVFISYSHDSAEHKRWVLQLAESLANAGVTVVLDQWHLRPGHEMAEFMEQALLRSSRILLICTRNYKQKADHRKGGVGFEHSVISGLRGSQIARDSVIPVHRDAGASWSDVLPTWAAGIFGVDLSATPYQTDEFERLLNTLPSANRREPSSTVGGLVAQMNQCLLSAQVTYGKSPQPFLRSFLSIVADLSEDEARILRLFAEEPTQDIFMLGVEAQLPDGPDGLVPNRYRLRDGLRGLMTVAVRANCVEPDRLQVYAENLERLGLVRQDHNERSYMCLETPAFLQNFRTAVEASSGRLTIYVRHMSLSALGRDFCTCCFGNTKEH